MSLFHPTVQIQREEDAHERFLASLGDARAAFETLTDEAVRDAGPCPVHHKPAGEWCGVWRERVPFCCVNRRILAAGLEGRAE